PLLCLPPPHTPTPSPYTPLFRSWTQRLNAPRRLAGEPLTSAAELLAGVALHELAHALIAVATADGPLAGVFGRSYAELSAQHGEDRKSTRLNSSHVSISYAVFCL